MSIARGSNLLMTPGPTNIPARVLQAMNRPAVELTGEAFISLCRSCIGDLAPVFRTGQSVFIYPANGHGAWEAALANSLSPGERALVPETGIFSFFWARMAETLGIEIEAIAGDWRTAVTVERVVECLAADTDHNIKAVLLVQTDTATGITHDVKAYRAALDECAHPALLMVDAVASLAADDFRMDDWGVDVAVGASQKALMAPPGLSFTAVSEKAMKVSESVTMPRHYWDWRRRTSDRWFDWFCGTAPEHLMFALRESLNMVAEEGIDRVVERHRRVAGAVHAAVGVWSEGNALELNAQIPGQRSNSVSTVRVAQGFDAEHIIATCRERFNVSLAGGLGQLDGSSFRIGHMGDINEAMILGALGAIDTTLGLLRVPKGRNAMEAAIASLSSSLEGVHS